MYHRPMAKNSESIQNAIDEIDLIERYPENFHRGELLAASSQATAVLDGFSEILQDDSEATATYLRLIAEHSDRFSDGEILDGLLDARRALRRGLNSAV